MRPTRQAFNELLEKRNRLTSTVDALKESAAAKKRAEDLMTDPRTATAAKAIHDMIEMAEGHFRSAINVMIDTVMNTEDILAARERAIRAQSTIWGLSAALSQFVGPVAEGSGKGSDDGSPERP